MRKKIICVLAAAACCALLASAGKVDSFLDEFEAFVVRVEKDKADKNTDRLPAIREEYERLEDKKDNLGIKTEDWTGAQNKRSLKLEARYDKALMSLSTKNTFKGIKETFKKAKD